MPPRKKIVPPTNEDGQDEAGGSRPNKRQHREQQQQGAASASTGDDGPAIKVDKAYVKEMYTKIETYQQNERKKTDEVKCSVSAVELEEAASRVVRAMLFRNLEKPGQGVRRQDLIDVVRKEQYATAKASRQMPALVISMAQALCCRVFGLEMVELPRPSGGTGPKGNAVDTGPGLQYVLKSMLPPEVRKELVDVGSDDTRGFQMLVMALIHLEGEKLSQEELFRYLNGVGLYSDRGHPKFVLQEELKRMEAKRWLVMTKRKNAAAPEGEEVFYERGEVGKDHISDAELKAFLDAEFKKGGLAAAGATGEAAVEDEVMTLD